MTFFPASFGSSSAILNQKKQHYHFIWYYLFTHTNNFKTSFQNCKHFSGILGSSAKTTRDLLPKFLGLAGNFCDSIAESLVLDSQKNWDLCKSSLILGNCGKCAITNRLLLKDPGVVHWLAICWTGKFFAIIACSKSQSISSPVCVCDAK